MCFNYENKGKTKKVSLQTQERENKSGGEMLALLVLLLTSAW